MASIVKVQSTNYENLKILAESCDVNEILKNISLRWKMQILYCISKDVYQFSKLKEIFPTLSDQILAKRIKELYQENLISKVYIPKSIPQQIRYKVTNKGNELLNVMLELHVWGQKWK